MASRSLGTLTLDLIAKIGGFIGPLDKAARESKKRMKDIEKSAQGSASAIRTAFAAIGAGVAVRAIVANTIESEKALAQLSATLKSTGGAAGLTQDELVEMAGGLQKVTTFGDDAIVATEALLLTFTRIGKDVFPEALESVLNVSTAMGTDLKSAAVQVGKALNDPVKGMAALSKAGIQFTEEQKETVKALVETGRAADAQRIILAELETQFGGSAEAARNTFGGALTALQNAFGDLLEGGGGNLEDARLAVEDLTAALSDPQVKEAFAAIVTGVLNITTAVAKALPELTSFTRWVGEELAAAVGGPAIGDMIRLEERLESLTDVATKFQDVGKDVPSGIIEEIDDLNRKIEATLQLDQAEQAAAAAAQAAAATAKTQQEQKAALAKEAAAQAALQAEAELAAKKAAEDADKAAEKAAKESARAAAAAAKALRDQIAALELQAETVGKSADEVTLYKLAQDKATDADIARARAALATVAAFEEQREAQDAYKQLVSDLRTEEEQLTEQVRERLKVLEAVKGLTDAQRADAQSRIAAGAFQDAPEFGGLAPEVGGAFGELNKIDDAQAKLEDWYATQLEMLDGFRAERADLDAAWDEQELALKQEHETALAGIEQARQMAQLSAAQSTFGDLAELTRTFAGEQSGIYKIMFAAQKGFAIAQSLIAIQQGIAQAAANPFPANLAAMATVAAATASIIGNIQAVGMAHDGIDSVPQDGTWLLQKGERVTTAETSAKLDQTLANIQAGMGGSGAGGKPVQVTVNMPGITNAREARQASGSVQRAIAQGVGAAARFT